MQENGGGEERMVDSILCRNIGAERESEWKEQNG